MVIRGLSEGCHRAIRSFRLSGLNTIDRSYHHRVALRVIRVIRAIKVIRVIRVIRGY